ncbi:MAG: hypothetical protein GY864_06100, partial [Desulfobacterales bacterium]|nr:hypothetical protein [Desulfobacterales bacterium]
MMKRISSNFILGVVLFLAAHPLAASPRAENAGQAQAIEYVSSHRWASSIVDEDRQRQITIHDGDKLVSLTQGHTDNKPVWSKEGDRLTFFRWHRTAIFGFTLYDEYEKGPFNLFKSSIYVINVYGTGLRQLTDGTHADVNPTWTRDESNQIIFNRLHPSGMNIQIYTISPDGEKGSEIMLTHPDFEGVPNGEWVESGLKDGRLFIWRIHWFPFAVNRFKPGDDAMEGIQTYHLLHPKTQTYEDVSRPNKYPVHKLSISPSETRVCYMKDLEGDNTTYNDAIIAYAELDLENLAVKNEVVISVDDRSYTDMYPRWTPD